MKDRKKSRRTVYGLLIGQLLCLLVPQMIFGQTETLDIVQFVAPQGWTKTPKDRAMSISDVNKATNGFCVITVYAATASAGSAQKDFANQWNELAVKPYKAEANPKTEAQTEDGWTLVSGASALEIDGIKSFALLTVFSGYGKTASVFSVLNDQSYLAPLDAFMASIKLDKTKTAANPAPSVQNNSQTPAAAQGGNAPGKFGHLIYTPMPGWKQTDYTNAISFTPSMLPPGYGIEVRVMESRPFAGTIQQAFAESWDEAVRQLESISERAPTSVAFDDSPVEATISYQGWEYMNGNGYFVKDKNNNTFYLNLFVVKLNNRIERMFAVSQKIAARYGTVRSLNQYSLYKDAYNDFFYSVKFDDWKDKGSSGSLAGGGIVGMYAGLKLGNGDLTSGGGLNGSYAVLFSNGQAYFLTKLPTAGFDALNTQAEADQHVRNWGTYQVRNGQGELTMPYGSVPLSVNGNGIILTTQNTPHQYVRLPSVDGAVFNGTYYFEGDFGAKGTPSVTFTADGKFIDNGAVNILYHNSVEEDVLNPAARPGSGTYQVRNYSLIFNYSDGRRLQIAFSGLGYDKRNPSPTTLTLSSNNDVLLRK
ncbi:MAG: hypothetical protein ACJ741_03450 [Pyrinomonadaceae bacterium]